MKTHWLSPSLAISPLALSLILAQSVAAPAATSATDSTTPPTSTPAAAQAPVNPVATAPAEVPKPPALSPGVADVARLNAGGVSPQVILEFIRQTREKYRLTADDILYLNQSRVPPEIVASMMQKHATIDAQAAAVVPQQPPAAPQAPVAIPAPPLSPPVVQTVYTPYPYPVYREYVSPYFAPAFYFPFRYNAPYYHYPARAYWQAAPRYSVYATTQFRSAHAGHSFVRATGFRHR